MTETIWITGASSGLGRELALQLAQAGHRVIASGRNQERMQALSKAHKAIVPLFFDVTDKAAIDQVRKQLTAISGHLDRVILNAGDCEYLDIERPDWQLIERMMQVNFVGLINSLEVCLPLLKKAPRGHLVGIGSQAILAPFPRAEGYGASKAAVSYFLKSVRIDLARLGIDVTEVLPGFVDTPLTQKNDFSMPFIMPASKAAARIIKGIKARPYQYIFPRRLSLFLRLVNLFPRTWLKLNSPRAPQVRGNQKNWAGEQSR